MCWLCNLRSLQFTGEMAQAKARSNTDGNDAREELAGEMAGDRSADATGIRGRPQKRAIRKIGRIASIEPAAPPL
jgi:hypothetical protein